MSKLKIIFPQYTQPACLQTVCTVARLSYLNRTRPLASLTSIFFIQKLFPHPRLKMLELLEASLGLYKISKFCETGTTRNNSKYYAFQKKKIFTASSLAHLFKLISECSRL